MSEREIEGVTVGRDTEKRYSQFFSVATNGSEPYPYQEWLALSDALPQLVDIPTGCGKTAAVVLAWLWRRRFASEDVKKKTPRRLVYCLPMRVLVEQTRDNIGKWLENLSMLAKTPADGKTPQDDATPVDGWAAMHGDTGKRIAVTILMGGEDKDEWDLYPERDAIIIGTQDMLLSRALNRGYGMSRYRWPMHFGLLNNDCLWVMDEVQLMGPAVETTLQLEAFRQHRWGTYGSIASIWMSATLSKEMCQTVDRKAIEEKLGKPLAANTLSFDKDCEKMQNILEAQKKVTVISSPPKTEDILKDHVQGSLSLVILNTVQEARELYESFESTSAESLKSEVEKLRCEIKHPESWAKVRKDRTLKSTDLKKIEKKKTELNEKELKLKKLEAIPPVILLHSQFRPDDRKKRVEELLDFERKRKENACAKKEGMSAPNDLGHGLIVITTQVVEAGVDISSERLWSEVAPWASIVQRLGRLNRDGKADGAKANIWMPEGEKKLEHIGPYLSQDLESAKEQLKRLAQDSRNCTPKFGEALREIPIVRKPETVIRPIDIYELFSTDPDLHGGFTDISRYVRSVDREITAQVLWRDFDPTKKDDPSELPAPLRKELCPVPFYDLAKFVEEAKCAAWLYSPDDSEEKWQRIVHRDIRPGMTILLSKYIGGYNEKTGWTGIKEDLPETVYAGIADDDLREDRYSRGKIWQTIAQHTDDSYSILQLLLETIQALPEGERKTILQSMRWHDAGKAHSQWQNAIVPSPKNPPPKSDGLWGKFVMDGRFRPNLRHELASALRLRREWINNPTNGHSALAVYLAAAHHGIVRCELRSNIKPTEWDEASFAVRNAFGVFEKDNKGKPIELPETDLGDGVKVPRFSLLDELECMEVGLIEKGGHEEPSWVQMVSDILGPCEAGIVYPSVPTAEFRKGEHSEVHKLGPFKLAYLETLVRVSDWRASKAGGMP
ncbi:MAG: DEAD/DEAH box helicase [Euryarchaeota archaeon]|nr:DEAD/DEAH box helicase [Euryarchaeota archaeon]